MASSNFLLFKALSPVAINFSNSAFFLANSAAAASASALALASASAFKRASSSALALFTLSILLFAVASSK
jgi:hypothetical protein